MNCLALCFVMNSHGYLVEDEDEDEEDDDDDVGSTSVR